MKKVENVNTNKYSRQILFWPHGEMDQHILSKKRVTIIGVGALGTVIANHLVRAGIGAVRLIDRDFVEESNLHRQMLFDEDDVKNKLPKVIAAEKKLKLINSEVYIESVIDDVNATNIEDYIKDVDLVLDGTDNLETRFLINDACVKHDIPWIYAGVIRSRATTTTIIPNKTPCFSCLYPTDDVDKGETCDTVGVINTVVHIIASYQATEALKFLIEDHHSLREEMIQMDVWKNDFDTFPFQLSLNPDCPCCQKRQFKYLDDKKEADQLISSLCGRDTIQFTPRTKENIDLEKLKTKWIKLGKAELTPYLLRLYYEDFEISIFKSGRILIKGTTELSTAKKLYNMLIGK